MKKILFLIIVFFNILVANSQCSYTGTPLTQVGSVNTFCIDNGNTITTASVRSGQFVVVNVVKGFNYTFSVGNVFTLQNENLTILDASTNANVSPATFASGFSGATISNWTSSLTGQIKILLSRASCINDNTAGGVLTLTLNSVGNTQDSQTTFGINQWVGHVYNYTGGPPPGGTSPTSPSSTVSPFTAANYVGYYNIATETITENFGGQYACMPVLSNGVVRTNIYTELFAVRYRMRSTKTGCYFLNVTGDDGIRVYVDGVLVFNEWKQQGSTDYCNNLIYLNGNSDIVFDFYEYQGDNVANFSLTPFVPSTNSISGASVINRCSGVAPGTLDGTAFSYCGGGSNPTISFQWQVSTDNVNFTNISGATAEDYAPPAITTTTNVVRYYRRVLKAAASNAVSCEFFTNVIQVNTSAATTLTIAGSISGVAAQCPTTAGQVYSIAAVPNALNYTWTVPTGWTITAGQGTTSITVTTGTTGQNGNIGVTASNGCVTSAVKNLAVTVIQAPVGGGVFGGNAVICINSSTGTMTLGGGYVGTVLNWEKRLNSGTWNSIATTSISYSESPSVSGTWEYRAVVGNGNCTPVFSAPFVVTVNPELTVSLGSSPTVCATTTTTQLNYTATTGLPEGWILDFDATANTAGFSDQNGGLATAPSSVTVNVPYGIAPGIYNAVFRVIKYYPSCNSINYPITITVTAGSVAGTVSGNQTICSNSTPSNLTLSGYIGAIVKWQKANDIAFTSPIDITVTTPVLTSASMGTISSTTYFRAVVQTGSCTAAYSTIATITTGITAIWNGTSWSTTPTSTTDILFQGNFSSTADVPGCSCTVSSGNVVINSTHDMLLDGSVTVSGGSLTFENNANLFQVKNVTNSGNITYKRTSSALKRLDYTLWSSPVTGSQTLLDFSPLTLTNRFYTFNTTGNFYGTVSPSITFENAKGYLIRMPNNHPTWSQTWNGSFVGVPNNGPISRFLVDGGSATTRYNSVGNPYPSAINIDDFLSANSNNIEGTLWFWRKMNNDDNPISYSSCTTAGCTINNGHSYTDSNLISAGQGFIVQAKPGATTVNFTNAMRTSTNVNQFFRSTTTVQKDRYWLDLKNSTDFSFGRKLIAYLPDATTSFDYAKDGLDINNSSTALLSVVDGKELIIQAKPSFVATDVVPLLFRTNVADNFSISVSETDGLFSGEQDILLKDNLLNTVVSIKNTPYTFFSNVGVFENRFEIVYDTTLANDDFSEVSNDVIVYKNQDGFTVNSNDLSIYKIKVFDVNGRLIKLVESIDSNEVRVSCNVKNQLLIVYIITSENQIVIKKIAL